MSTESDVMPSGAPRFPTMLRKMWSGAEVQAWIDARWMQQVAQLKRPAELGLSMLSDAERAVLAERGRQVNVKGWTPQHDDEHDAGELAMASAAYALAAADAIYPLSQGDGDYANKPPEMWPWASEWWKPSAPMRMLEKSAALAIAEMERIAREEERHG